MIADSHFLTRKIDVITLIWRGLPLSICRHMRHDIFLLPFRPLADKKVRLLPRDMYACVTRHGDIHKIAEKLRREKGRIGENRFCLLAGQPWGKTGNFCADEHRAKFLGTERRGGGRMRKRIDGINLG